MKFAIDRKLPFPLSKLILTKILDCSRFGPNTFPAHNSALFSCETQVEYIAREMIAPILNHRAATVEVTSSAEDQWVNRIHSELSGSVFQAGCSNWYINEFGRNAASWPGYASTYWKESLIPRWNVLTKAGGSPFWLLNRIIRMLRTTSALTYFLVFAVIFAWRSSRDPSVFQRITQACRSSLSLLKSKTQI